MIFFRFLCCRIPNRASEINADPSGSGTLFPNNKKRTTLGLLSSRSRCHCLSFSAVDTGSQWFTYNSRQHIIQTCSSVMYLLYSNCPSVYKNNIVNGLISLLCALATQVKVYYRYIFINVCVYVYCTIYRVHGYNT